MSNREQPLPTHTFTGERIRPVHKPYKRAQCTWVNGLGWVHNPGRRRINMGEQ